MIYIYKKIIGQRQIIREEIRKRPTLKYKKENWVFLKRNLKRKNRFSQILNHKFWKLFRIKKRINEYFYELELFRLMKIYSIFNIYRLKKIHKKH